MSGGSDPILRRFEDRGGTILPLARRPDLVPAVARLYEAEWPGWYGSGGPGDALADLHAAMSDDGVLPWALVALSGGGVDGDGDRGVEGSAEAASVPEVLGTVCLRDTSPGSELHPGAWLTALVVDPEGRGQGIASALIAAAETAARAMGFDRLHTSTDSAASLLARRGWKKIGETRSGRGALDIYAQRLDEMSAEA